MSDKIYPVPAEWAKRAFIDDARYQAMYQRSLADPDGFLWEVAWNPFFPIAKDGAIQIPE